MLRRAVPVETFHRLVEIDMKRRETGQKGVIDTIRFIPSSQRKLYHQFVRLQQREKKAVEKIIEQGPASIPEQIRPFGAERQLEILDTVLAYHKYRLVTEGSSPVEIVPTGCPFS